MSDRLDGKSGHHHRRRRRHRCRHRPRCSARKARAWRIVDVEQSAARRGRRRDPRRSCRARECCSSRADVGGGRGAAARSWRAPVDAFGGARHAGQHRRHPLLRAARRGEGGDLAEDPRGQPAQLRLSRQGSAAGAAPLRQGRIVNVSSTHAFNPRVGMGQYDVTKAGIIVDDADARLRGGAARRPGQCASAPA